jgi:predicted HAD superfamily Cof-like phosphohydrolase
VAMTRRSTDLVREFHIAFNRPVRDTPDVGSANERVLRVRLMLEEVLEFAKAAGVLVAFDGEIIPTVDHLGFSAEIFKPDLAQMAHELADVQYVVSGTAVQLGIPLDACVAEIHSANMRKLGSDGKPIVDAHGKVRKPDGWRPADVASILRWERLFQGEQTPECASCPDRADFEQLCCKGGVGAMVTDPGGLLCEDPKCGCGAICEDRENCPNEPSAEMCPKRKDETHCEHWQDGKPCCDCGAPADPDVCQLCGAADGHNPDCETEQSGPL